MALSQILEAAPTFSASPSHPFELLIKEKIESLGELIVPFVLTMWAEGHLRETSFLKFHYERASDKHGFLDFLEHAIGGFHLDGEIPINLLTDLAKKKFLKVYPGDRNAKIRIINSFIEQERNRINQVDSIKAIEIIKTILIEANLIPASYETVLKKFLNGSKPDSKNKIPFSGKVTMLGSFFYYLQKANLLLISPKILKQRLCEGFTANDKNLSEGVLKNIISDAKSSKVMPLKELTRDIIAESGENSAKISSLLSQLIAFQPR